MYNQFSTVYDMFMDNLPYDKWADCLHGLLKKHGIEEGIVLDLGCGTGTMTELMAKRGYEMIGIDISSDMLSIAAEKKDTSGLDILYLCQDMRHFELHGTVKAIICVCDSINYILTPAELVKVFQLVNRYLDPEGIFIFDFKTPFFFEQIGDSSISENREEASFIWENDFDEESKLNICELTLFIQEESKFYRKFHERHIQRAYEEQVIKNCLVKGGLSYVSSFDNTTEMESNKESERIFVVAKEQGKNIS